MKTGARNEKTMKNYLKRKPKKALDEDKTPARITNETVAEHREQVLAGGRKFKYPRQYQKHKLVINSIAIGIVAIVLLLVVAWQQLYVAQSSSGILYRMTQLIPVHVASVDGEPVRYSDYLSRYRSSLFYYRKYDALNETSADGGRQAEYTKRQELTNAEKAAFARKLAPSLKVTVTNKEVDDFINADIAEQGVSLRAYENTVLRSYYNWSLSEYRDIVQSRLLRKKVSFAVDDAAHERVKTIQQALAAGGDFVAVARQYTDDTGTLKENGGDMGSVALNVKDAEGLAAAAAALEPGQLSEPVEGTNALYVLKLVSKDTTSVHYLRIKVDLTEFDKRFDQLRADGKIKEYITIQETETEKR